MHTRNFKYNTEREASGLEPMRNAPLGEEERDLLICSEEWLTYFIGYPALTCLTEVFSLQDAHQLQILSCVIGCASRATALFRVADTADLDAIETGKAKTAAGIYQLELQRQLGALFPIDDPFWQLYYSRQSIRFDLSRTGGGSADTLFDLPHDKHVFAQRYGLFFIPLDALHALTGKRHQLEYELLVQSLRAALIGGMATGEVGDHTGMAELRHALDLVRKLKLSCYEKWIQTLQQRKTR